MSRNRTTVSRRRPAKPPALPPVPRRRGAGRSDRAGVSDADLVIARALAEARRLDTSARGRPRAAEGYGGSTVFRNRRQLVPHLMVAALLVLAGFVQLLGAASGSPIGESTAVLSLLTVAAIVAVAVVRVRAPRRWRPRLTVAALAAVAWLAWAGRTGLTWGTVAALLGAEVALSARRWQATRLPHPQGPPATPDTARGDARPARDNLPGLWQAYVGCPEGALAGATLHSPILDDHRETYTVELVPGKHSLGKALAALDRVQSGLRRPQEEIILEPHPSGDSAQLKLTVVTKSPIKDAVVFDGPKYFRDGDDGWIEAGRYADGEGRVRVSMYAANSARHVVVFGGQGSGKTALLNQMAVSAQASGHTTVFYVDGQDGASSPQLMQYADWAPTGPGRADEMLSALERIFAVRGKMMQARRLAGLTPSPDLPGLVVIIDECHLIWQAGSPQIRRWVDLASLARKLNVAFWAATQHPELASFGNIDKLRSLLMQYTTLVLRTTSGVANNILRLSVDPSKLPTLPGYGYLVAGDKAAGVRSAPFRADFLDDANGIADAWFAAHPGAALDRASAKAAGPTYDDRTALAERRQRDLEDELTAWMDDDAPAPRPAPAGESAVAGLPAAAGPDRGPGGHGGLALALVPRFPRPILAPTARSVPAGLSATQATVWGLVAAGTARVTDLAAAAGLSPSQTYKVLGELVEHGDVVKTGHGRYQTLNDHERAAAR